MVSQYPLHVCINTRQSRISWSSSCLSESPRNSSRVTSRCVHTAYNMVPAVIDVCDVRCETHTMSRSGALHVVTVAFLNAARKRFCWADSSPHASVIVCDVAHVWIEAVCVYVWVSYMRFNPCVCICGHGCIGHISAGLNPGQRSVLLLALWLQSHPMTQQACGALVVTLLQQFTV